MKTLIKKAVGRVSRDFASANAAELKPSRDVDLVLAALLARTDLATLNDAVAFTGDVRGAIEPIRATVTTLKTSADPNESDRRFASFGELLAAKIPPASMAMALKFARVADDYRGSHDRVTSGGWSADVARHFAVSSSSGRKGRLLAAAVGHFAPRLVFELGTAYGISGLFVTHALKSLPNFERRQHRLVTVEGFEPQATLSRALLEREADGLVTCEKGLAADVLPRIAMTLEGIDLYFHDAGHTYDDYTRDVGALRHRMSSGSVLFLDDIRWDDRRYVSQPSRAYEGWLSIVHDARTRAAFEIDGELGVALFA